jgi:hypothetical protein
VNTARSTDTGQLDSMRSRETICSTIPCPILSQFEATMGAELISA